MSGQIFKQFMQVIPGAFGKFKHREIPVADQLHCPVIKLMFRAGQPENAGKNRKEEKKKVKVLIYFLASLAKKIDTMTHMAG
jgi:hypothetical protein